MSNPEFINQMQAAQRSGATNPTAYAQYQYYVGYYFAANLVFFWLPGLAVTIPPPTRYEPLGGVVFHPDSSDHRIHLVLRLDVFARDLRQ